MKKRLFLFWNIGKSVYSNQKKCENVFKKYSILYTYQYGMPYLFSISNIKNMLKFYYMFPIYYSELNNLSWNHYCLILNTFGIEEQYFYYRVALFCNSSVEELETLIKNFLYERIKKEIII